MRPPRPATGVSRALRARSVPRVHVPEGVPENGGCARECPKGCPRRPLAPGLRSVQKVSRECPRSVKKVTPGVWDTPRTLSGHFLDTPEPGAQRAPGTPLRTLTRTPPVFGDTLGDTLGTLRARRARETPVAGRGGCNSWGLSAPKLKKVSKITMFLFCRESPNGGLRCLSTIIYDGRHFATKVPFTIAAQKATDVHSCRRSLTLFRGSFLDSEASDYGWSFLARGLFDPCSRPTMSQRLAAVSAVWMFTALHEHSKPAPVRVSPSTVGRAIGKTEEPFLSSNSIQGQPLGVSPDR